MYYLGSLFIILTSFFINVSGCPNENNANLEAPVSEIEMRSEQNESTTFILVRHAEKDTIKGDPELTQIGHKRAQDLARFLSDTPITAVYSSDYKRTKQTAQPTADAKGLKVNLYDPRDPTTSANEIFSKYGTGTVLVVGHSNSTPNFVNILLGKVKIAQIDESDYDNIFIVQATELGLGEVLHFHYGK